MNLRGSYLILAPLLIFFVLGLRKVYINKGFLIIMLILTVSASYNISIGKNTLVLLLKQIIGIGSSAIFFYILMRINKGNIERLLKIYLNLAVFIGMVGLFQEFSYIIGFKLGYDYSFLPSWRLYRLNDFLLKINSIISEPAAFCYVMMPAFFIAITGLTGAKYKFLSKWKSGIIILSVMLSFSATGYIGILTSIFLVFYNYGKIKSLIHGIVIMMLFGGFFYTRVDSIKLRVDDSVGVLSGKQTLYAANPSTFVLYSHALIAYRSFKENPLFGSGLGSHLISYNKFIGEVINTEKRTTFLNMEDANSLFLRLLSETGIVGLAMFFYFIFKFHIFRKNDPSGYLWVINNAILVMFMIRLVRSGHYFNGGLFFFVWMYYFSSKIASAKSLRQDIHSQIEIIK